jgi:outer membrane receptor protein involved in Fe transport
VPTLVDCTPFFFRPEVARDALWENQAWQAGLAYAPRAWLALHGRVASSFRSPNPDDVALAAPDLRPQRGEEFELGLRLGLWQSGRLELAGFAGRSHDEIRFEAGVNRNLPGLIERRGVEASLVLTPVADLEARLNLTHVNARFASNGARVPLVPELAGSAAIGWTLPAGLRLDLASLFAGSRLDGAELGASRFPLVPAWHVESLALSRRTPHFDVQAGVNNLFDATWATTAFGATYYPLLGREVYARVALSLP